MNLEKRNKQQQQQNEEQAQNANNNNNDDDQPVDFSIRSRPQITTTKPPISGTKRKHNTPPSHESIVTSSASNKRQLGDMNLEDTTTTAHLHSSGAFNGGYPATAYHLTSLHHSVGGGQRGGTTVATNNATTQLARDTQQHHHQHQRRQQQLLRHHHHPHHHHDDQPPPPQPPPQAQQQQQATSIANEGDYRLTLREELKSSSGVYQVLEFLGRGTFGQVVKCWKLNTNELYAVKILKNQPSYIRQGQIEVQILNMLGKENADDWNFVRAFETFTHHDHTCLVFELLGKNLYDYARSLPENRFKFKQIRPILQQVLRALSKLRQLGLIHADLKPENIMLVNPDNQPCRVKVIDFGSASKVNKDVHQTYLQSRYYRAPEIILGLGFDEKIDMWSLGCVAAELYLGQPLYPGSSEYDQIRFITETQGTPNLHMLRNGEKTHRFFTERPLPPPGGAAASGYLYHQQQAHMTSQLFRLKTHHEYEMETGQASKENRKFRLNSLEEVTRVHPVQPGPDQDLEQTDSFEFLHMLRRMMVLDPIHRMKPNEALNSSFITMAHLVNSTNTQYYQDSIAAMEVCGSRNRQLQAAAVANYQQQAASFHPAAFPTLQPSDQQVPRGGVTAGGAAYRNPVGNVATGGAPAPAPLYFYGFQSSPHARTQGGGTAAAAAAAVAAGAMFQQHIGGSTTQQHPHHRFVHNTTQQQVAAHVAAHVPLISQAGQLLAVPGWNPTGFAAVAAGFSTPFMGNELLRRQHTSLLTAASSGDNIFTSYQPPPFQQQQFHQQQQQQFTTTTRTTNNNNHVMTSSSNNNNHVTSSAAAAANNNVMTSARNRRETERQQPQPIFISDSPGSVITISSESDAEESMIINTPAATSSTRGGAAEQVVIHDDVTSGATAANQQQQATNRQQRRVVAAVAPFQQHLLNQQRNGNNLLTPSLPTSNPLAPTGGGNIILPFTTQHMDTTSSGEHEELGFVTRQQQQMVKRDVDADATVLPAGGTVAWGIRHSDIIPTGNNSADFSEQQRNQRISSQNRKRQRSQVRQQQRLLRNSNVAAGADTLPSTQFTSSTTSSSMAAQQRHHAAAAGYLQLATEAQQAAAQVAFISQLVDQQAPSLYPSAATHHQQATAQQHHHAATAYRILAARGQAPYLQ